MSVSTLAMTTRTHDAGARNLQKLEKITGQVVGSVFYGTLLKTMRGSRLQGPYGHGGRGEEIFAAQLDGLIAERLGMATQGGVKDALLRHLAPAQERYNEQRPNKEAR